MSWQEEIERLKLLLRSKMSQREFSRKINVHEKDISKFFNPKNVPRIDRYWFFKEKIENL